MWRLHWPAWLKIFNTDVEGAGADHHAKGGSWDTTKAIFKKLFREKEPISFKFGLILFNGKKYSKSKGLGLSAYELLNLLPPQVIAFSLLVPDVQEDKDIPLNKEGLLKMVERYERASFIDKSKQLSRAEEKMLLAYSLVGERSWQPSFREIITYFSIYGDWNKVKDILGSGVNSVINYIDKWMEQGFIPEDLDFRYKPSKASTKLKPFFQSISEEMTRNNIQSLAFNYAKQSENMQQFFKEIYQTLIKKDRGPRIGSLIKAIGVKKVLRDVL